MDHHHLIFTIVVVLLMVLPLQHSCLCSRTLTDDSSSPTHVMINKEGSPWWAHDPAWFFDEDDKSFATSHSFVLHSSLAVVADSQLRTKPHKKMKADMLRTRKTRAGILQHIGERIGSYIPRLIVVGNAKNIGHDHHGGGGRGSGDASRNKEYPLEALFDDPEYFF